MATVQLVQVPLVSGSDPLSSADVQSRIRSAEQGAPEGARMQLDLTLVNPSLPFVGAVDLAQAIANGLNQAAAAGRMVSGSETIRTWPGESAIAAAQGNVVHVRWVKGVPWAPIIIGVLLGIVVLGILVYAYIHHWSLSQFVEQVLSDVGHTVLGPGPLTVGNWLFLAAAIVLLPPLLGALSRR